MSFILNFHHESLYYNMASIPWKKLIFKNNLIKTVFYSKLVVAN